MRTLLFLLVLFSSATTIVAQLQGDLLLGLTRATDLEMANVANPVEGSLLYNTDQEQVFVYNGTDWTVLAAPARVHLGLLTITGTGNLTVGGLPFTPSQVSFVAHANIETLNLNSDNGVGNNFNGIPNAFGTMNGFARANGTGIEQQVIYVGGNGTSINDISRYASSSRCIGIRYSNQNGDNIGTTEASLSSFNPDAFTLNISNHDDDVVVLYRAYE
ncbi:hypothetical protein [Maribacter sp. 2307ULW6-5]|uniref:hypothetical protein n=1 Tax=Maribacter sp. 2307ULW6-5 TaxID=3386275 RepID=UPI0039BC7817